MRLWAGLIALAALASGPPPVEAGSGGGPACAAFLPGGLRDAEAGNGVARALGLDPERLYVLRRDRVDPADPLPIRDPRPLPPAALSPRGDFLAYSAWREASCDPAYSLRVHFAVVADTAGEESAVLPGVWNFAWSPEGDRLAVVYAHPGPQESYVPDSIGVIDIRTRQGTTFQVQAASLSWRGSETLVLQSSRVQELNLRTREVRTARHRPGLLSPDLRYSLSTGDDGDPLRVVEDATGLDSGKRIRALLGEGVEVVLPPFWVGGDPPGHRLCIPVKRPEASRAAAGRIVDRSVLYRVEILDVAQPRILRSIPGIGLAATSDRRAVVVFRDGGLSFEDL